MRVSLAIALALLAVSSAANAKPGTARPYVLMISDGQAMTRMNYPSQRACLAAIAEINSQFDRRLQHIPGGGILVPPAPPKLFCIPR